MLRYIAKEPLRKFMPLASNSAAVRVPVATQIHEFSTNQPSKESFNNDDERVSSSKHSLQTQQDPWDTTLDMFWRRHSGFDEIFSRDPFFAPFSKHNNSLGDPFERLRNRMMRDLHHDIMPVLRTKIPQSPLSQPKLVRSSPGYEIKETEDAYEIVMELPGEIDAKDLNVEVEESPDHGNVVLRISGERHTSTSPNDKTNNKNNNHHETSTLLRFSKQFTIGSHVDKENLQANFADGCLVVRAPKLNPIPNKENVRKIPISTRSHAAALTDEEVNYKTYNDAFDESDWAETGKMAAAPKNAA